MYQTNTLINCQTMALQCMQYHCMFDSSTSELDNGTAVHEYHCMPDSITAVQYNITA